MSRYADLDALEKELNERLAFLRERNGNYDQYTDGFDEAVDRVENFPAADVAPVVHARFIETERPIRDGKSKVYGWECTACKRFTRSPFVDSWNFCPNCGAKMEKDGGDGNAST